MLVAEIRAEVGDDCRIVLPALPVALAAFQEPLRSYVVFLATCWDEQKQRLAKRRNDVKSLVEFVQVLRRPLDCEEAAGYVLIAADGLHPSERGYDLWAQHIATSLLKAGP